MDWDEFAARAAQVIADQLFEVHRGVLPLGDDLVAIFGNDGYDKENTRSQVWLLRLTLSDEDLEVHGFATTDDLSTWAMIVECDRDLPEVTEWLWEATRAAFQFAEFPGRLLYEEVQRAITDQRLGESRGLLSNLLEAA